MSIALINKLTGVCENVAVFDKMQTAIDMLGGRYILTEQAEGYGIGDIYKNGRWEKKDLEPAGTTMEDYLLNLEYRIAVMELGGNGNDL